MYPEIIVKPRGVSPFEVELVVFEEDTYMLLSAGNFARDTRRDTGELIHEMEEFTPPAPGELLVKGNRAYAIVHDLEQEPSCRPEWVDAALDALMVHCRRKGIRSLAIQPLGCVHGTGTVDDFSARVRRRALDSEIERIWIMSGG